MKLQGQGDESLESDTDLKNGHPTNEEVYKIILTCSWMTKEIKSISFLKPYPTTAHRNTVTSAVRTDAFASLKQTDAGGINKGINV